jgi:hypothetical protein
LSGAKLCDVPDDMDSLMYAQAMDTWRSLTAAALQATALLAAAYTAIVGVGVTRRSWGLLAAATALIAALCVVRWRYLIASNLLLQVARSRERTADGALDLAGLAHRLSSQGPTDRPVWRRPLFIVLVAVAITHVAITVLLAVEGQHWSFDGS